jgi:type II secretory pathway component PulK
MKRRALFTGQQGTPRRGSALVCVLVCLSIAMSLVTSRVQSALQERRTMRTQHQLRQTEFLLAAGVLRASRQLAKSEDYAGETWQVDSEEFSHSGPAQIVIQLELPASGALREVHVSVQLPTSAQITLRRSCRLSIEPQRVP